MFHKESNHTSLETLFTEKNKHIYRKEHCNSSPPAPAWLKIDGPTESPLYNIGAILKGFQGVFNWADSMTRGASFLDDCTSDR